MATTSNGESGTLSPLPNVLRHGLVAVGLLSVVSFVSTSVLLVYLTYKFLRWRIKKELGEGYNQFLILVYNLLLADLQQAVAFNLTLNFVSHDAIGISTSCWVQGWFVSTGDLSSSLFIFAIAVHTFFAIVKEHRMPPKTFAGAIISIWIFVYLMAIVGVAMHPQDLYNRAGAWCWIDAKYSNERLWLHYFWLFVAMFGTIFIYMVIYLSLQLRLIHGLSSPHRGPPADSSESTDPRILKRAARYMMLYPLVYVFTTLPLAGSRMAAMKGDHIPLGIYCYAGAAITSSGWIDCLLYAGTRRALVFSDKPPKQQDLGLNTFGILHPGKERWGVTTEIAGPLTRTPVRGHRYGGAFSGLHTGRTAQRESQHMERGDALSSPVTGMITTQTVIEIQDNLESDDSALQEAAGTVCEGPIPLLTRASTPTLSKFGYVRPSSSGAGTPIRAQRSGDLSTMLPPRLGSKHSGRSSAQHTDSLSSRHERPRTSLDEASRITITADEADDVFK